MSSPNEVAEALAQAAISPTVSSPKQSTGTNDVQRPESLPRGSYPEAWKNDSLIGDTKSFYSLYDQAKDPILQGSVRRGRHDDLQFLARQHASPDPMNCKERDEVHVAVAKELEEADGKWAIDVVKEKDLASMMSDGWHIWGHPQRPIIKGIVDKDERTVQKPHEKINHQKPYRDTQKLFGWQISLLQGSDETTAWRPGQVIGVSANADTNASLSSVYKPPTEFPDLRSSTFFGFSHYYRRPMTCGLGWGDWDRFHE